MYTPTAHMTTPCFHQAVTISRFMYVSPLADLSARYERLLKHQHENLPSRHRTLRGHLGPLCRHATLGYYNGTLGWTVGPPWETFDAWKPMHLTSWCRSAVGVTFIVFVPVCGDIAETLYKEPSLTYAVPLPTNDGVA